jgi:protein TonB
MITKYHWLGALTVASLIHIAVFIPAHSAPDITETAKDVGEMGVEVDLGMLGDLGVAMAETMPDQVIEEPEPIIEEPIVEPEPLEDIQQPPEPKPEPIIKPIEVPKKIVTEKETVKITKQAVVKPKPKKVIKEVKPVVKPQPIQTQKSVKETLTSQVTQATRNNEASKKITTGSQSSVTTGGNKGVQQSYIATLSARLAKHKRYPNSARKRGQEGTVTLFFVVRRDGKVTESYISLSSGYKKLDDAVIRMLKKASPLPPFPEDMEQESLTIRIPIEFKLNDKR